MDLTARIDAVYAEGVIEPREMAKRVADEMTPREIRDNLVTLLVQRCRLRLGQIRRSAYQGNGTGGATMLRSKARGSDMESSAATTAVAERPGAGRSASRALFAEMCETKLVPVYVPSKGQCVLAECDADDLREVERTYQARMMRNAAWGAKYARLREALEESGAETVAALPDETVVEIMG